MFRFLTTHRRLPRSDARITACFVLASSTLLFPLACDTTAKVETSDDDSSQPFSCTTDQQCPTGQSCSPDGACSTECATCPVRCQEITDCPSGQICSPTGECTQECDPNGNNELQCGTGVCSASGVCLAGNTLNVPYIEPVATGGASAVEEDCIETEVSFDPVIPNVVLLIDQSGSMTDDADFKTAVDAAETAGTYTRWDCPDTLDRQDYPDDPTLWDDDEDPDYAWRWNVVRNVLLNPETGIVKPLENAVRFGQVLYSSDNGDAGETCPMLTEVELAFGSHQAMLDAFPCSTLIQDTPTRESLTATAEKLAALDVEGPKVIVLATDGLPDTCECANWTGGFGMMNTVDPCSTAEENNVEVDGQVYNTEQYEQYLVAQEAKRIHDELGISIEVINVGAASLKPHLDEVAMHGGAISGESIAGTSPGTLTEAFRTIIDGVRSCVIDLDGEITEGKEDTGTVQLDRDPTAEIAWEDLVYNDPNGWRANSPTQIELVGEACEDIKSGDHEIDVSFPCDAFIPIVIE